MYEVPMDFDLNRRRVIRNAPKPSFPIPRSRRARRYGPLSGVSFPQRLLSAYENGLLPGGLGKDGSAKRCSRCGGRGHLRMECVAIM